MTTNAYLVPRLGRNALEPNDLRHAALSKLLSNTPIRLCDLL